jgi:hypothetical protein
MLPNARMIVCVRCEAREARSKYCRRALKFCLRCGVAVNRLALKQKRAHSAASGRAAGKNL